MGARGCLSISADRPDEHRMFAERVTAEYFVRTEGRGQAVNEWKARPEQPDNHWLDCLVGCAVGASMQGAFQAIQEYLSNLLRRDHDAFGSLALCVDWG